MARGIDERLNALIEMKARLLNMTPVMRSIGEMVIAEAQQSFVTETSPDGSAWPALSPVTIARRHDSGKRERLGRGVLGPRRLVGRVYAGRAYGIKMLRDNGRLFGGLSATPQPKSLKFGADVVYGRALHEGNPKNKMFKKWSAPIPARRFFPVAGRDGPMRTGRGGAMWVRAYEMIMRYLQTGRVD